MSLEIVFYAKKIKFTIPSSTRNLKYLNNNRQLKIFKNGHLHQHFKRSIASQIPLFFGNNFIYYKKNNRSWASAKPQKSLNAE